MRPSLRCVRAGLTNCYVLRGAGTILIDSGEPGRGPSLLRRLEGIVDDPSDISLILATHGHWDHIGGVPEVRKATGADLAMHDADATWASSGDVTPLIHEKAWGRLLLRIMNPVFKRLQHASRVVVDLVFDDAGIDLGEYGVSARVVPTPGHTPGSVSVVLDTGEAIVGDLAMSGLPLVLGPSLATIAVAPEQLGTSWQTLVRLGAEVIYPAHGRPFPVEALQV